MDKNIRKEDAVNNINKYDPENTAFNYIKSKEGKDFMSKFEKIFKEDEK